MITLVIIAITVVVSLLCFYGPLDFNALKFSAYDVWHRGKWWQMLTHGFVHGGWGLIFPLMLRPDIFQHFLHQLGL